MPIFILFHCSRIFICTTKHGFYIDEYYTYTLSNGTHLGIAIENEEWNTTDSFYDELVTNTDSLFSYAQTCKNTADDVHPPVYYLILNTICSFFPGLFSKWFALSINIISFAICLVCFYKLSNLITHDKTFTYIFLMIYTLNPATLSSIIYLRMYFLLSVFVCIYLYLHLKMMQENTISFKYLLPLFLLGFLGFLTHYYMLFSMFCISFFFACYFFFVKRQYRMTILYSLTVVLSLVATYFVWPVSIFHMFKGYRGKGATQSLTNIKGLIPRILFFLQKIDVKEFSHLLMPLTILIIILTFLALYKNGKFRSVRSLHTTHYLFLLTFISTLCYFIMVSFTALKVDYSNRYLFPMEGCLLFCVVYIVWRLLSAQNITLKYNYCVVAVLFLAVNLFGISQGSIDYRYSEHAVIDTAIRSSAGPKTLVFYDANYDSIIGDLIQFESVYFAGPDSTMQIVCDDTSEYCESVSDVLIYVENSVDSQNILDSLIEQFVSKNHYEEIGRSGEFYSLYRLY